MDAATLCNAVIVTLLFGDNYSHFDVKFHWNRRWNFFLSLRLDATDLSSFFYLSNFKMWWFQNYIFMFYDTFLFWCIVLSANIYYDFLNKHSIAFCMQLKENFKMFKPQMEPGNAPEVFVADINIFICKQRRNNQSRKIIYN